jgi:hypothetical protein
MTITPGTEAPRTTYTRAAEIAKMIRAHLKREFPKVKFSVRTEHGTSVNVVWTDGPTTDMVDKITHPYAGARFDGMYDLEYHARAWYCPEHGARVAETFGHSFTADARAGHGNGVHESRCCAKAEILNSLAKYVFTRRELSPEFRAELESTVAEREGRPYDGNTWLGNGTYMSDLVYRLQRETPR